MLCLLQLSAALRSLLKSVWGVVPLGTKRGVGYVVHFIARKLTMGRLSRRGQHS